MTHCLPHIDSSPHDYKLCKRCGVINWYENESCHNCGNKEFSDDSSSIDKYINNEYSFYVQKYGRDFNPESILITVA